MGGEPLNVIGERKEAEASNPSFMHLLYLGFHHQRIFIYKTNELLEKVTSVQGYNRRICQPIYIRPVKERPCHRVEC